MPFSPCVTLPSLLSHMLRQGFYSSYHSGCLYSFVVFSAPSLIYCTLKSVQRSIHWESQTVAYQNNGPVQLSGGLPMASAAPFHKTTQGAEDKGNA